MQQAKLTLWQRLERVMEAMRWDEADLRRELGLSPQQIWNYKNRNGSINAEIAFKVQRKTMFNPRWIVEGEGPERITQLSAEELTFVERLRKMTKEQRLALLSLFGPNT
jgi:hypothetical protein